MLEYCNCNLCGKNQTRVLFSKPQTSIVRCKNCGLIYENPRLSEEEALRGIVTDQAYADHKKEVWLDSKIELFKNNLKKIEKISAKARLLDIGCGYGIFLKLAKENGWQVKGIELSGASVRYIREELGLDVCQCGLKESNLPGNYFDVVTLWGVLDLIYNPLETLGEVRRVLKERGVIALRIENAFFHVGIQRVIKRLSWIFRGLGISPSIIHRYSFSPSTIRKMLEKAGFTDIKVYVSEFTKGDPYSSGGLLGRAGTIIAKNLWYYFCQITFVLSLGRLIFSPTMLVFARNAPKGAPKKTRVLQIITRFNRGGSALALFSLVLGLEADKFDVSLMSGRSNELYLEEKDLLVQKGIGYIYIPELVRDIAPLKDIMAFWKMFYFIKNGRFDIVHAHTSKAGFLGRWAAWFSGTKKIVYTPHGHIFYGYFGKIANIFFVYLEKATAFVTDKIVALTERGRQEYLAYKIGPPDKFSFIYSGIDIEKLKDRQIDKDKEKQRLNIPLDRFLIGTVTRYEPVKGNKYLIFAAVQVIRAYPASMFIIVGDGSQRKMLESLVRRSGINENVMFIRHTQDVIPIVSIFDIFVLPSLNEGMGRVLLEAQALGVPVVATGVGGVPCVVKDGQTGIIVPPKDPKALAEAIVKLIQDEEMRKRLAMQAREWIGQDFSSQTMIKKYSELYTQLLAKDKK